MRRQLLPDRNDVEINYDAKGNITSITPPGKSAHKFQHTKVDLVNAYKPPAIPKVSESQTTYDITLDRNIDLVSHPDELTIDPIYDRLNGRLQYIKLPDSQSINMLYSPVEIENESATGHIHTIRMQPDGVNLHFKYDGFLLSDELWEGPVQGTVSRSYDQSFQVQSYTVNSPELISLNSTYDEDGLLKTVQAILPSKSLDTTFSLTRDPNNGIVTETALNNVTTHQTYNDFGELASFTAKYRDEVLFSNVYSTSENPRDKLGRIIDRTETIEDVSATYHYEYDNRGRLINVTVDGLSAAHYEYDANGNRIAFTDSRAATRITNDNVEYDDQDRLLRYGDTTYTYRANGELNTRSVNGNVTRYHYDALGNLRQVLLHEDQVDNTSIEYIIDGRNRRIGKKLNGKTVQALLYQDQLNPIAELDGAGNVVSLFVYGSRENVPDFMVRNRVLYRIICDHLGSVRLVVDASTADIAQRIDYDEYGRVLDDTAPGFQPFGFAGGIYDPDTGLVRFGARDYDPETGRWTAKDPILFAGGDTNLYRYVLNDPVNKIDLNGYGWLSWWQDPLWSAAQKAAFLIWWSQISYKGGSWLNCLGGECVSDDLSEWLYETYGPYHYYWPWGRPKPPCKPEDYLRTFNPCGPGKPSKAERGLCLRPIDRIKWYQPRL
jgi:RHS repeat-associated protein